VYKFSEEKLATKTNNLRSADPSEGFVAQWKILHSGQIVSQLEQLRCGRRVAERRKTDDNRRFAVTAKLILKQPCHQ